MMRRGRNWRGSGHFRGGGAGFNPRGFLPPGPPRLNRPPWPRAPLHRGPPEHYYGDEGYNKHFVPRNFSPQKGSRHGFQRGYHEFQQGRLEPQEDQEQSTFKSHPSFSKPPPKQMIQPWANPPPVLHNLLGTPSLLGAPNTQHNFEESAENTSESQHERVDTNKGQKDTGDTRVDFLNSQSKLRNILDHESQEFEEGQPTYEKGSQNHPEERHYRGSDFRSNIPSLMNFPRGPPNFQPRPKYPFPQRGSEFHPRARHPYRLDRRVQSEEHEDFSQPPPFMSNVSHDYTSDDFEYDRPPERRVSSDVDRPRSSGRPTQLSHQEYSGQRPPATDHYIDSGGGDDGFHKSIGDTVDIIKKRLQDRQENPTQQQNIVDPDPEQWSETKSTEKQERSPQRHSHKESRRHHRTKSDRKCARMKKKIVRELFKMDKKSLHKLVDDPQSSAKFEFAVNSLITESRNSLNRQMRSVAEKSLSGISSRCEKDDTVYEDTFMAQMQGVLDPRGIVMLTDIKPMVMAEINKVLQLDEYGQTYSDEDRYHPAMSHRDSYESESYFADPFDVTQESKDETPIHVDEESLEEGIYVSDHEEMPKSRQQRQDSHRSHTSRRSSEPSFPDNDARSKFPGNVDSISDDEYPFAELDRQYHVAVEYSMLDTDRSPTPQRQDTPDTLKSIQKTEEIILPILDIPSQRSDDKVKDVNESHIKIETNVNLESNIVPNPVKKEIQLEKIPSSQKKTEDCALKDKNAKPQLKFVKKEIVDEQTKEKTTHKEKALKTEKPKNASKIEDVKTKPAVDSNLTAARKREADDKISHRKEKRKKCDSTKSETNKKVLNSNIIINVNDCASKTSEKCEPRAKFFNLFIDQGNANELREDSKVNISYSDKYVKRKQANKVDKNKKTHKKELSTIPNTPSKDPSSTPTTKAEKVKLQPIDMFDQNSRKSSAHTAVRNTAVTSPDGKPIEPSIGTSAGKTHAPIIVKKGNIKIIKSAKTLITNSTQTVLKVNTRFTQTKDHPTKKMISKLCQTDPPDQPKDVNSSKPEDVMERMKEIDLEIQQLLQEKFKLYKNLENTPEPAESMQSLGMAIVNLNSESMDESKMLDTFAQMSEEELQEIALQGLPDTSILDIETESTPKIKKSPKKSVTKKELTKIPKAKKKNVPKVVLKLNKNSADGSEEHSSEYEVVKSPKKLKKVTFENQPELYKQSRQRRPWKPEVHSIYRISSDDDSDSSEPVLKKISKPVKVKKPPKKRPLTSKELENLKLTVRNCSIVLTRTSFSQELLNRLAGVSPEDYDFKPEENIEAISPKYNQSKKKYTVREGYEETTLVDSSLSAEDEEVPGFSGIQLHDDMLDVSEDIVIDGNCDIDKPMEASPVDEDCSVVDNGTSREEVPKEAAEGSCKLYDFSPNGEFGTEMVAVSGHGDAVVAIECVNNNFLAACIDGNVYHYNGRDGRLLATLRGSNFPLTCLCIKEEKYGTTVYTGSLDSRIRYYDLDTGMEKGPECNVLSPIQSMDRAWDTIFVGTRTGFVLQFECKNNLLIPVSTLKFSEQSILAIRAMKEGPRKVLLIASRSDQITVKDAQTGLLLRTLDGPKMTVYSLLFENGKVFAGTSGNHIQVFDFTSGSSVGAYTSGAGVVCLRAAGGLLLAGCYDGCVYVYRGGPTPVAQLRGPTDMLLSLAIVNNCKIIASYKNRSVFMWKIPESLLQEMIL